MRKDFKRLINLSTYVWRERVRVKGNKLILSGSKQHKNKSEAYEV